LLDCVECIITKLAPCGTDDQLLTNDVSAKFEQSHVTQKLGKL